MKNAIFAFLVTVYICAANAWAGYSEAVAAATKADYAGAYQHLYVDIYPEALKSYGNEHIAKVSLRTNRWMRVDMPTPRSNPHAHLRPKRNGASADAAGRATWNGTLMRRIAPAGFWQSGWQADRPRGP